MNIENLSPRDRNVRGAIRAYLLNATLAQLEEELRISIEDRDDFRAACIRELIANHGS